MTPGGGDGRRRRTPRSGADGSRRGAVPPLAAAVLAVAILLPACGGGGDAPEAGGGGGDGASGTEGFVPCAELVSAMEDSLRTVEEGLRVRTLRRGAGAAASDGDSVTVHYTGCLPDGTRFDASRDRDRPFSFVLGAGRVIRGWDLGVRGMRPGERRLLVIPPELGYGSRGAGEAIPPGSTLLFRVELLEVVGSAGEPDGSGTSDAEGGGP